MSLRDRNWHQVCAAKFALSARGKLYHHQGPLAALTLASFAALGISCSAVKTDVAPVDGIPYAQSTEQTLNSAIPYAPSRDGVPYYLPRSLLNVTVTAPKADTPDAPTIRAKSVEIADQTQRYVAYYAPNPFSDDALCVARSDNGLLQKIYFSGNDRTSDVLLNVVQLAGNVFS